MFVVLVIFEPSAADRAANADAVHGILDRLVAGQPGFRRARLHTGTGATPDMVVNYMEWDDEDAFRAFRDRHGAEVTEAVGRFAPRFTFFQVAHTLGPWPDPHPA
ncbi:MAG: antibiotic biosynthesis monooxygenase family protein [Paracoccaceae bacterium]